MTKTLSEQIVLQLQTIRSSLKEGELRSMMKEDIPAWWYNDVALQLDNLENLMYTSGIVQKSVRNKNGETAT